MVSCQLHIADAREGVPGSHGNLAGITQQVPELFILHFDLRFDVALELFLSPAFEL